MILYHYPKCSKSRQALELLQHSHQKFEVVEYMKQPLSVKELECLLERLGIPPHDLIRDSEDEYQYAGLSPSSSSREIVQAITKYPILMQRPILTSDSKAIIGRPPERVLELC